MQFTLGFITLALALTASARSMTKITVARRADFDLKNGQDAIALNDKFKTLTPDSPCNDKEDACVGGKFAQCVGGKLTIQGCGPGTICAALPLVNKPGTSITCTTQADLDARIAATGAQAGGAAAPPPPAGGAAPPPPPPAGGAAPPPPPPAGGAAPPPPPPAGGAAPPPAGGAGAGGDPQTSLTLDPKVIAKGFSNDGQSVPAAGQVASATSSNNFINFCLTVPLPLTDGKQIEGGSCNPAPMGSIPSKDKIPTSKFVFPKNLQTIEANKQFTIQMKISNLETGNFVNAQQNYFSAPQQLNGQGIIKGHSHVVIQKLASIDSTDILDPTVFAFFKGLNDAAKDGILTADVTKGLPAGIYKISSINSAANHQPALAPIAQHGAIDDHIYFTVA